MPQVKISRIRNALRSLGLTRSNLEYLRYIVLKELVSSWFLRPYFNQQQRRKIVQTGDPVRYGSILLALDDITKSGIVGSLAEVGVYRGTTSKFIHQIIPNRPFYLFDTFEGFHPRDLNNINHDERFRDTGVDEVVQIIGNTDNITIKKGYFPDTTSGLESETFAFVMIDLDKYDPTLAALKFFYPRINSGGYIFVHDYNSPESDWACSKALNRFLSDKPEKPIGIPDGWGTVLFRKF